MSVSHARLLVEELKIHDWYSSNILTRNDCFLSSKLWVLSSSDASDCAPSSPDQIGGFGMVEPQVDGVRAIDPVPGCM